jgi:hypothetical protein
MRRMKTGKGGVRGRVASLVVLGAAAGSAGAATLISDNFNDVASGGSLNGRTPQTTLNGAKWTASTVDFLGNGGGGLAVDVSQSKSANLDLGANFFANNPGVYDLSAEITVPTLTNPAASWIALGFAQGQAGGVWTDVGQNHVGANGAPWLLWRMNGQEVVFGGPSNAPTLLTPSVTTGTSHTFTIELDTTGANWAVNAFLDGVQQDLNGTGAGNSFTYATNPTSRFVAVSTGVNQAAGTNIGTGTLDNFVLTGPTPVPEPGTLGLVGVGLGWLAAGRRRR